MAKKTGLGRSFDTLIPTDVAAEFGDDNFRTKKLLIQDVIPNPDQPRKVFEEEALAELAASIKEHGFIQPIVVVSNDGKYMIIAGERRWRAAQHAGLDVVPAIIRTLNEQQQIELALIENIQREDLNPLEMAAAFQSLIDQFDLAWKDVAQRVGKAEPTVINTARLLNLPEPAKRALQSGKITEGHCRAILMLKDEQKQQELLDHILRHGWNVRKAEHFAKAYKEGGAKKEEAVKKTLNETKETKSMSKFVRAPVKLQPLAKGGRIVIDYKDDKDLKRITKKFSK